MSSVPSRSSQLSEMSVAEEPAGRWAAVLTIADLAPGDMAAVAVGDLRIAIYNIEGQFFATENVCTHAFAILTDGWLEGNIIECPLHAGQFDVRTGCALGDPVTCNLRAFKTRVRGDRLEIFVP
ncbi:nitrite reductase/ring-hydroxylating ferredoxin subunit [Bradyrhizobium sp. USDA 4524]|nr:nitrite reductase/ring-hydroxylating ferredoxin subunit [Bradyrhizobium sp. USDA 4538]MCP1899097.1 nitrite reductase/ring-hydroxylating ferredoxin subunit [Bradyrhizobium sp. USDA 4537]MCP1986790.1 nitrite reductase/ring-hydroxylating ferredoxin subunit [Bradyrhizobium sp. USDA 4539]